MNKGPKPEKKAEDKNRALMKKGPKPEKPEQKTKLLMKEGPKPEKTIRNTETPEEPTKSLGDR